MSNEKKNIKVRDLKPKKDAKGGGHFAAGTISNKTSTSAAGKVTSHAHTVR